MTTHPTSFKDWQIYPSTLDPIHLAWLKKAKISKTAFSVADIEGVEISHKKFLTGVLLATAEINKDELKALLTKAKINPLHHPAKVIIVEEIPKLGSGKTDFGATKKIALVNDQ